MIQMPFKDELKGIAYRKTYYQKNKIRMNACNKEYYKKNRIKLAKKNLEWRIKNKEHYEKYHKEYRINNKGIINQRMKKYYKNNVVAVLKKNNDWYLKNIECRKKYANNYYNKKYHSDALFKLARNTKSLLSYHLKSIKINKNGRQWETMLGYTREELNKHLDMQFTPPMNIFNHGSFWHIDHKIPLSYAKNEKELIELFQLDNLQPLEGKENIRKSNKVIADLFGLRFENL
jgi:hypothetical protein